MRFLLVGDGVRRESLLDRVRQEDIPQVSFLPFQPEGRFARIMAASDVCLVVLQPGLEGLAVPSKAYTSMGAGKPLIALMEPHADVARLVVEHDCGWNVTSAKELAALVGDLTERREELPRRGMNGRKAYEQRFNRDRAVARYVRILSSGQ